MKIKTGLVVALIIIANAAHAVEIKNGRLLSHKVWSTTGETVIENQQMNGHMATSGQRFPAVDNVYIVDSYAKRLTGSLSAPVNLANAGIVEITNYRSTPQTYSYGFRNCVYLSTTVVHCVSYNNVVELEAGGSITDTDMPQNTVSFPQSGTYLTEVQTYINHDGQNVLSSSSQGSAVIS